MLWLHFLGPAMVTTLVLAFVACSGLSPDAFASLAADRKNVIFFSGSGMSATSGGACTLSVLVCQPTAVAVIRLQQQHLPLTCLLSA